MQLSFYFTSILVLAYNKEKTVGDRLLNKASAPLCYYAMSETSAKSNRPKKLEEILNEQIKTALREYKRPNLGLFLSALAAGLEVGFSFFVICIMYSLFASDVSEANLRLIVALAYPVGFIFVVIGRSELFTEHTTLAILPVLAGSANVYSLLVLWVTIYTGNLVGGYIFSSIFVHVAPAMQLTSTLVITDIAEHVLSYSNFIMLMSATIAGWLMGLVAWLVTASTDTISRIFVIILVTAIIGLGTLHHSIVGSIEVFSGFLVSPEIRLQDYLRFQLIATLGNLIGGVVFVAIIKYSHTSPPVPRK